MGEWVLVCRADQACIDDDVRDDDDNIEEAGEGAGLVGAMDTPVPPVAR